MQLEKFRGETVRYLISIEDEDEYQRYQEVGGVQLTIHSLVVQIIEVNWLNKRNIQD